MLSNQNIATPLLVHTYTADQDRMLFVRAFLDQAAGNGMYSCYATIQRLGAGSAYEVQPRTTPTVASGVTSIAFTTVAIPIKNTDVLKVYLLGLAGDTTTPDIVTEIWENDALCPTTAGRTLDVSATGEAGIDWANVGSPSTTVGLSGTTVKAVTDNVAVGSIAANAITASSIATDALGALELAADAVTEIATAVWAAGTRALTDKVGFTLASDGLDAISITEPAGVAANFREMMLQLWMRYFYKTTLTSTQLKTYSTDSASVKTTQAVSDAGGTQTIGKAS
jgi:hypothetical protein